VSTTLAIQLDLFEKNEELEGQIFELYEKSPNREFKSHIQFVKAESIRDAEDKVAAIDSEYWRTKSIRTVNVDYAWHTFEKLHYSYNTCKSILGLDGLDKMLAEDE
jgi:hypothetical protein